jgi:uncharacterized protein
VEASNLPLLEIFTKLREAGLPLGIDDYQLLLQALQGGFGIEDKAALKRLCQSLWIKSPEERALFNYHFQNLIESPTPEDEVEESNQSSPKHQRYKILSYLALGILEVGIISGLRFSSPGEKAPVNQPPPTPKPTQNPTPTTTPKPTINPTLQPIPESLLQTTINKPNWTRGIGFSVITTGILLGAGYLTLRLVNQRIVNFKEKEKETNTSLPDTSPQLSQIIEDEIQVVQAIRQVGDNNFEENTKNNGREIGKSFLSSKEYFPVTQRQMKQLWRYLRRPSRQGLATELDIEATVKQIGNQGILLAPVFTPPRVNLAELIILIDRDGSMVPFHTLSNRLVETAMVGGLSKTTIYYFHNSPLDYLYHDPYHQEAILIDDILNYNCSGQTVVLIISDAGSARGGYSDERYELTKDFLTKLQKKVRYIAWLNPLPQKRWFNNTAQQIKDLVPMFEISRLGMQNAIGVLRGKRIRGVGR